MGNTGVIETEERVVLFDLPLKQFGRKIFREIREILLDALRLKVGILKMKSKTEPSFISTNIIDNGAYQIKNRIKKIEKR